ncbi:MAG TPA: 7-carboxy-7-deazaguanine synthase QueE [Gemmatales bacterium]|nr:7-carboxy-7-deazaguanine synthase QueE [Gemmatales bacterium]
MRIAEIFHSVQGEGMLVGMPSVFVRTSGCNLRCSFCDTPYTSWNPEGSSWSVNAVIEQVKRYNCQHVVVTGGEPLIAPEMEELCQLLKQAGYHITIETAATVFKPLAADLMSLSPKLANSTPGVETGWADRHDRERINLPVIQQFLDHYECQFKFVMDAPEDLAEVQQILGRLLRVKRETIFLMPQALDAATLAEKGRWLAELCKTHGYRLGSRLHIDLWGHTRGT